MPSHEEIKALVLMALKKQLWQASEVNFDDLPHEQKALLPFWPDYFDLEWGVEKCSHCSYFFIPDPYMYAYNCPQCGKPASFAPDWYVKDEDWQPDDHPLK